LISAGAQKPDPAGELTAFNRSLAGFKGLTGKSEVLGTGGREVKGRG